MTSPISKKSLNLFISREEEIKKIDKILKLFGIVIIEGDYGVGKTSLGNYYRFSREGITPIHEISTNIKWTTKDFLNNVLKNIVENLKEEQEFQMVDLVKKLNKRYDITEDININPNILGNSIGFSSVANKDEIITETGLIYDLTNLAKIANKNNKKLIIQLNNLDLGKTLSEDDLLKFFAINRNIFQISNVYWILTGGIGLTNVFKRELPKFGSIISKEILIKNLDTNSIIKILKKRNYQFDKELIVKLIELKNNNLREIINLANILNSENLTTKASLKEYFDIFSFNEKEIKALSFMDNWVTQKELAKKMNLSATSIRKLINKLKEDLAISQEGYHYRITFEAYCNQIT